MSATKRIFGGTRAVAAVAVMCMPLIAVETRAELVEIHWDEGEQNQIHTIAL